MQSAKKNELKPFQREQYVIPKEKSAEFVCQMEQVLDLYELPYDEEHPVVCMDESPKQIIDYQQTIGTDGKQYTDSTYTRFNVADLFVAFEPLAGWRDITVADNHKAETWVQFIANLMDTRYKDAKSVTWVLDNLSTHKAYNFYKFFPPEQAQAYLNRINFVYTPTHGSWLNMAEIQFSVLTRQALNRPFSSQQAVEKVTKAWVIEQNNQKRGTNWQFKTKDARIKLAKLYPTI
ncbi:MAG TPA: IS630 family transposase [Chitinophagales bacterium]|nr:IS630 family transposase [Chitinophagales bacterium]